MSKMAAEPSEQTFMLAPADRRSSIELLDEVAEFEQSVGFPLLERHWVVKYDTSSERSASPVDPTILTADGQPLDDSQHPVLRTWSPSSNGTKKLTSLPADIQAPLET